MSARREKTIRHIEEIMSQGLQCLLFPDVRLGDMSSNTRQLFRETLDDEEQKIYDDLKKKLGELRPIATYCFTHCTTHLRGILLRFDHDYYGDNNYVKRIIGCVLSGFIAFVRSGPTVGRLRKLFGAEYISLCCDISRNKSKIDIEMFNRVSNVLDCLTAASHRVRV